MSKGINTKIIRYPHSTSIILDSNIYIADFHRRSKAFEGLNRYLKLTSSLVYIPEVVYKEVLNTYETGAAEFIKYINKQKRNFSSAVSTVKTPQALIEEYKRAWDFDIKYDHHYEIIGSEAIKLDKLIDKAIKKSKPFSPSGTGFRDAVIWENVVNLAASSNEQVVFISNNGKDFGHEKLDENLFNEVSIYKNPVKYFSDIAGFLQEYASNLEFLSKETVQGWIDNVDELFTIEATDLLSEEYEYIFNLDKHDFPIPLEYTNYDFLDTEYLTSDLTDYYIYREDDDYYYIEVIVSIYIKTTLVYEYTVMGVGGNNVNKTDGEDLYGSKLSTIQFKVNKITHESKLFIDKNTL
ncbi:DUF4935 domain-containing protein [Candidatus Roizmanbacteria bacterium]|nr:DUF4935 domain-containing protein [Candidatus Roizmanbacteria bacterium]